MTLYTLSYFLKAIEWARKYGLRINLDLHAVAGYYGCTYDTLQNRFRKIKKDAEALKGEHKDEEGNEVAPIAKATPRKQKTPKKDQLESKSCN